MFRLTMGFWNISIEMNQFASNPFVLLVFQLSISQSRALNSMSIGLVLVFMIIFYGSESDEAGGINGGGCSRDVGSSGGSSSDNRNAAQHPNAQYSSRSSQHQAASTEREFKNPLYDTSATRKAVSSTKNASAIAAPKVRCVERPVSLVNLLVGRDEQ